LDFRPHGQDEDHGDEDEQSEDEREAQPCELSGAFPLDLQAPFRPMEAVRRPDRIAGVDRRRLGSFRCVRLDLWLGPCHVAEV
jgi:hypothetical protein